MTARVRIPKREISEAEFQRQVTDLAEMLGWSWMHIEKMSNDRGRWRTPVSGPLGKGFPGSHSGKGIASRIPRAKGETRDYLAGSEGSATRALGGRRLLHLPSGRLGAHLGRSA